MKMEMSVDDAYKRSLKTLLDWVTSHMNMSETQVFFRTYAPVHFRFALLPYYFFLCSLVNASNFMYIIILCWLYLGFWTFGVVCVFASALLFVAL